MYAGMNIQQRLKKEITMVHCISIYDLMSIINKMSTNEPFIASNYYIN